MASPTCAVSPADTEHLGQATAEWSTGEGLEAEMMATQTGRETKRAKTLNIGAKEIVLEGMGMGVALLMETDMTADLRDPKGRDLPLEKLVLKDMNSIEVVQEVMCEMEGSIQEGQAPAADRH